MGAFCRITLTSCYKLLRLQIHNCAQLNVILLFSRNIEASCHKHFVVVSREQQTTPPLTCHCPARLCVHVLHLAVQPLTARAEDRYWPRIGDFCLPLRQNIAVTFGMEKLEWCGYAKVTNFWRYFDRMHEGDRQTNRQTDTARRHRPRLCVALRGKNRCTSVWRCIWHCVAQLL